MKKIKIIVPLLLVLLMTTSVLAWGASRSISGNEVTVTVDPAGGAGVFTIQETGGPTRDYVVITTTPAGCGLANNVLTCDYDEATPQTFVYQTLGSGTVSGTITGGYPSETQSITGDTAVPGEQAGCLVDADCEAGLMCVDGVCLVAITAEVCDNNLDDDADGLIDCDDPDCDDSLPCAQFRCLSDADCPAGQTCVGGTCLEVQADSLDTFLERVRDILSGTDTQLQKISAIASALRDFFNTP